MGDHFASYQKSPPPFEKNPLNFVFSAKTNVKTYNVNGFEEWETKNTERYGYCGKQQLFSVKVSSNEDLNSFFNTELVIEESKGNRDRGTNWILGFKNETK